jgi:hypothetical protein
VRHGGALNRAAFNPVGNNCPAGRCGNRRQRVSTIQVAAESLDDTFDGDSLDWCRYEDTS